MSNPLKVIELAITQSQPALLKKNWRECLRDFTGPGGVHCWQKLADLRDGKPIYVTLPDGRMSMPIIPTADVQLRAATTLAEMGYGRAVLQTEIVKAEQEARDFEAVRALSDEELEIEAAQILEARRVRTFTPGPAQEVQFILEPTIPELSDLVWDSIPDQEQDP